MKNKRIKFEDVRITIYAISIVLVVFVVLGKIELKCFLFDNYGILCPACGLTRATIAIVRLNFAEALKYNAFYTLVLVPLITVLVFEDVYTIVKRKFFTKKYEASFVEIIFGECKK